MSQRPLTRILAIDVKSRLLGVAVFEPPVGLLDWGKRAVSADSCGTYVTQLLRRYVISAVVVRELKSGERRDTVRARKGLHAIRMIARRHSIPVVALSGSRVRRFFRDYERYTRYEIARFLAVIFPYLTWALPRARMFYEPENRRMALFDSVALGLAFLGTAEDPDQVRALLASAAGVFTPASR